MSVAEYRLEEVAEINPRASRHLAPDDLISFVPMSALDAETGKTTQGEDRAYQEVSKGYTGFWNGDLLVAKITPCFENGKIGQADLKHEFGFGSTEFHVIRPDSAALDSRYLFHYLRQKSIRIAGEKKMTGSGGQRRVPAQYLAELKMVLPSLAEQKRIAAILDQAESLRAKRRAALEQLDALAQAIFIEMFGDPIENPKALSVKKLSQIGTLDRGVSKHRPRNDPALLGGKTPLIQTAEVAGCDGYIRDYSATYSDLGLKQSRLWPEGTLCITIAANIAKTGILTFESCFPDSVVGFSSDSSAVVEYVRCWLSFLQQHLERNAPASAQKNINLEVLRNLDIPVPPLAQMQEFERRLIGVEDLKRSIRASSAKHETLFASLQHRAFRGEL